MSSATSRPTTGASDTDPIEFLDHFHDFLLDPTTRVKVMGGGAGSGKSFSVSQHLCMLLICTEDLVISAVRKYRPSLKHSSWRVLKDQLRRLGLTVGTKNADVLENKTDLTLTCEATGSIIDGIGLDDQEKIKSYETNVVWAEEATELTREDFMQLDLRCRRSTRAPNWDLLLGEDAKRKKRQLKIRSLMPNKLILTYNPIDSNHWVIKDLVESADPRVGRHHSTYLNNPYLDEATVTQIENLIDLDENWHRVYALGRPGVLQDLIYTRYEVLPFALWPESLREREPTAYGEDFGFNNPSAVVAGWNYDGAWYIDEVLYQSKLTNHALMARMEEEGVSHTAPIYADSAEPDRITEQCSGFEGKLEDGRAVSIDSFNVLPADKRSLKASIDHVKAQRLIISAESVNLIKEIHGYKWRRTKDGVVLDEPVPFNDHAMDAMRYLIWTSREESGDGDYDALNRAGGNSVQKAIARNVDEDAYAGMRTFGGSRFPF